MGLRLFLRDLVNGSVREYGSDRHDCLILRSDGAIEYVNLQNGDGTGVGGGYQFCREDGSDPRELSHWEEDPILDIGGDGDDRENPRMIEIIEQIGRIDEC